MLQAAAMHCIRRQ